MSYIERKELFKQVEEKRKKPLITYVTSIRPGMGGRMAGDAIRPFIDQLECIPKETKDIDFLIISNGGDPITALRMIGVLRERFNHISVLLPYVAYSAATVLSLGADEIVMHQYSNLGPVDPQMTVSHRDAKGVEENIQFGAEDIANFIEFIKTDVGLSEQQQLLESIRPLIDQVGVLPIGNAKRSQRLSMALSEKMLKAHIDDEQKVESIAKALNSSYYHHGYAVGRKEATEMGLPVTSPDRELETIMWKIWLDYEKEMKCDEVFDVMKEILDDPTSSSVINSVPIINIPANLPEPQKQAIFSEIVKHIGITQNKSIRKSFLIACIESSNISKVFKTEMVIRYWRDASMNINFNVTQPGSKWTDN